MKLPWNTDDRVKHRPHVLLIVGFALDRSSAKDSVRGADKVFTGRVLDAQKDGIAPLRRQLIQADIPSNDWNEVDALAKRCKLTFEQLALQAEICSTAVDSHLKASEERGSVRDEPGINRMVGGHAATVMMLEVVIQSPDLTSELADCGLNDAVRWAGVSEAVLREYGLDSILLPVELHGDRRATNAGSLSVFRTNS